MGNSEWDELPTSGVDQSCAFCGSRRVTWVHPLDRGLVEYRKYGKGHTLPSFWCTCDVCEDLVLGGNDDQLLERMRDADHWGGPLAVWTPAEIDEGLRKPLGTFRHANLGSIRLAGDER